MELVRHKQVRTASSGHVLRVRTGAECTVIACV
jgi:hypothetical protein